MGSQKPGCDRLDRYAPGQKCALIVAEYMAHFQYTFLYPSIMRARFDDILSAPASLPVAFARMLAIDETLLLNGWKKTDWRNHKPKKIIPIGSPGIIRRFSHRSLPIRRLSWRSKISHQSDDSLSPTPLKVLSKTRAKRDINIQADLP